MAKRTRYGRQKTQQPFLTELNRIGTNANQLARKMNSNKFITKEDKVFICNQLDLFIGDMKAIKYLIESQTESYKK